MADVPGVTNLKVEPQVLVPQIEVRPRADDAARFGLTPGHIRRVTTLLLRGQKVGEIYEGPKRFDVTVWGTPEVAHRPVGAAVAADRHAGRDAGAAHGRGRRRDRADAERDQARRRPVAADRHHLQREGPGPRLGRPRRRGEGEGGPVRPRVPPGVPGRVRGPAGIDAATLLAVRPRPRGDRGAALHGLRLAGG